MAENRPQVLLVGGTRDGETVTIWQGQRTIYMTKRISQEEAETLRINWFVAWKPPEEVYVRSEKGLFVYDRTVHYKPRDDGMQCEKP